MNFHLHFQGGGGDKCIYKRSNDKSNRNYSKGV